MDTKEMDFITFKYHKHLDGSEEEGMMYFTLDDVRKCMIEYNVLKNTETLPELSKEVKDSLIAAWKSKYKSL